MSDGRNSLIERTFDLAVTDRSGRVALAAASNGTYAVGSLCSGYEGIGLALAAVLDVEPVWFADNDPAASAVLAHRWPGVPNHGDITAADWSSAEPVDVLTAGWPCQPWSSAGRRKGAEDERAIWPAVARAVRELRPWLVVLENVPMVIALGELARAVGDLAACRYDAAWTCVRASDVGAPHRRERVFIVARPAADGPQRQRLRNPAGDGGAAAADAAGPGRRRQQPVDVEADGRSPLHAGAAEPGRRDSAAAADTAGLSGPHQSGGGCDGPVVAEPGAGGGDRSWRVASGADDLGRGPDELVTWGVYRPAIDRWATILGRPAPTPTVLGRRGGQQLNPIFVEWLMGLPAGWVCDVPGLTRTQQLKLLGNGVVIQQCAAALRWLLPQLAAGEVAA